MRAPPASLRVFRRFDLVGPVNPAGTSRPLTRFPFLVAVAFGGALFWIVRRPPMGDLPQHASQVALLHDLVEGTCPWSDIVRINYFTPYVLPLSAAAALSFVLPVLTAVKLVLTAAYFGFIAAAIGLRKEFEGDERIDWLFLPGFFGLSFGFGFYTFLVATPAGLLFVLLAKRFALFPSPTAGLRLVAMGALLFFSHGLVFGFSVAIGLAMAILAAKRSTLARALIPYGFLTFLALAYGLASRLQDPLIANGGGAVDWEWDKPWGWHRLPGFLADASSSTLHDPLGVPVVALMLAAPWLLGARPTSNRLALVPITAVVLTWLFAPGAAMKSTYLYPRFAVYLLPAYALAFRAGPAVARARVLGVGGGLALLCFAFLGSVGLRERRFARESASFEAVLSGAEPGHRALSLVFDPSSRASHAAFAYHAYPMWYQAERKGFVDFNFAYLPPEIVRFRPDRAPPMTEDVDTPSAFDWHKVNGAIYRYFFVRHTAPLPADLFANDQCRVALVREDGPWSLYERRECTIAPVAAGDARKAPPQEER